MNEENESPKIEETNILELPKQEKKKGSKKKVWISLIIVIVVLLILIGGYIYYFYFYQTAERFMDSVSNKIVNVLSSKIEDDTEFNDDIKIEVGATINKDYKIDLSSVFSNEKKAFNLKASGTVKNDKAIDAELFYQDSAGYFEVPQLFDGLLKAEQSKDTEKEVLDSITEVYDVYRNLNYYQNHFIKYYMEALKEGELSMKVNNLMEKEYTLEFNTIAAANAAKKMAKLYSEDEVMMKFFEDEDFDIFSTFTLTVKVNVWTNQIKEFNLETVDGKINAKYDGEKYIVHANDALLNMWFNDEYVKLELYENKEKTMSINYNYDDALELYYVDSDTDDMFSMDLVPKEKTKSDVSIKYISKNNKINLTLDGTYTKENTINNSLELNGTLQYDKTKIDLKLNEKMSSGKNLYEEKDVSKAKDELSEEDNVKLMTNVMTILEKLGILDELMALMEETGVSL